jgi:hypothetical protein
MAFIVKRDAPPAGIPVENTNSLLIDSSAYAKRSENDDISMDAGFECGGYSLAVSPVIAGRRVYASSSFGGGSDISVLMQPGSRIGGAGFLDVEYTANTWVLVNAVIDNVSCFTSISVYSTNPSTDPTTVPTTNWSPNITITSA